MFDNFPIISIVIPMYNAENYIAECLESILAQTFQNFEVIVVNDCSTDSSVEIVENYLEKFGGRLRLAHMEKNSGSGALPRNKGMELSLGKYIFFVDDDDLITPTALEELYTLAKNYNAEVVYCERNYSLNADTLNIQGNKSAVKPTFETEDLRERVHKILQNGNYEGPQWIKLVRRDLIFKHELFFPNICPSDDEIWTYGLVFYAKKFLRVPNAVYICRLTKNSLIRKEKTPQKEINFWLNPLIFGLKSLDDLMDKIEFFRQNPLYRCALLENFVHTRFSCIFSASLKLSLPEIYESIKQNYGKSFGDHDVLISFLLADLIEQQKIFVKNRERISELEQKNK